MKDDEFLSWENAAGDDRAMLDDLQPNILKGHARDALTLLFLTFDDADDAGATLADLTTLMKSARTHLGEVKAFKTTGVPGTPYVGVGISKAGYDILGVAAADQPAGGQPADNAFDAGMRARPELNDDHGQWEPLYLETLHAVVLVGDSRPAAQKLRLAQVRGILAAHPGVKIAGEQEGRGLHNANGDGIEHFGYVDGRSQPLFLREDILDERLGQDGISAWDARFAIDRVLVADKAAPDPATARGSFFIYRKLEQNVKAFKTAERDLAYDLGLAAGDAERAGAMIVGRFEDGTPLTTQKDEGAHHPVPNDFNYDSDGDGGKCPFFGHIRKLNPRGSGGFGATPEQERRHLMARRGQTYGLREDGPNDGEIENKPEDRVGLLFMAFNASIEEQFEFTQIAWANNPNFPQVPTGAAPPGVDLVIGQLPPNQSRPSAECPLAWGARRSAPGSFIAATAPLQTVTTRGGEYFFMPSLSFLGGL